MYKELEIFKRWVRETACTLEKLIAQCERRQNQQNDVKMQDLHLAQGAAWRSMEKGL